MPSQRPQASFEPIPPDFDLKSLVSTTPNFHYVDRISCDMIDEQGTSAFEKLVAQHVIVGGKPLIVDGYEERLDLPTFTPKWLQENYGEKVEIARDLSSKASLPLTVGHYLKNMGRLATQLIDKPNAWKEKNRQRMYLKDIDCPAEWWSELQIPLPRFLCYLNDSTDSSGAGGVPEALSDHSVARAGDLMSSLPPDMRAENLMCYIGHEGTYTPAHREMCASLGQNIMVEASTSVSDDGKAEKPGSSLWFMTESKDRHLVSEYWLSVLEHDIEVETHFAQLVAWEKAPFSVYVVEQRPGDLILIPPLAPHQVWNRGTRTMKVAWNRTTVETLELAINEALPRSRIVCRDEQYKNKAIVYYTLQRYSALLLSAHTRASQLPPEQAHRLLRASNIKQLAKDFRRLFNIYLQILLTEMFKNEEREVSKDMEYLPYDSNVTCAYCRANIFNRFLTCPSCVDMLGHNSGNTGGDPYDVCLDCYAMGRSCACISKLKWVEQFRWKELASNYETWRRLIIDLDGGKITTKTPLILNEEQKRYGRKTLAEVCKEQLKCRPWKDVRNSTKAVKSTDEEQDDIEVGDNDTIKKIAKKRSRVWLKNNTACHVCCKRHPNWRMAVCTVCDRKWCFGSLFRGWDKMPIEIMQDDNWECAHCLGICFAGACRREGNMQPYEPKGTLLGHDTRKVADVRSVEALVDFSVSNLNWLKEDRSSDRMRSRRMIRARADAERAKKEGSPVTEYDTASEVEDAAFAETHALDDLIAIDPALTSDTLGSRLSEDAEDDCCSSTHIQQTRSVLLSPTESTTGSLLTDEPNGHSPMSSIGQPRTASIYGPPTHRHSYKYPGGRDSTNTGPVVEDGNFLPLGRPLHKRRRSDEDGVEIGKSRQAAVKYNEVEVDSNEDGGIFNTNEASTRRESNGRTLPLYQTRTQASHEPGQRLVQPFPQHSPAFGAARSPTTDPSVRGPLRRLTEKRPSTKHAKSINSEGHLDQVVNARNSTLGRFTSCPDSDDTIVSSEDGGLPPPSRQIPVRAGTAEESMSEEESDDGVESVPARRPVRV